MVEGWVEPMREAVNEGTAPPTGVTVCRSPEEVSLACHPLPLERLTVSVMINGRGAHGNVFAPT